MDINYNFNSIIKYNDNNEYRKCIRELFYMNTISINDDIDEVTKDEMDYDDETISKTMGQLFTLTKDNLCFQQLYELAAALMISTNKEIGQVVLFSYDNLPFFHSCLASFYREPENFNENNTCFLNLKRKLT
jgi:hypothetical protein